MRVRKGREEAGPLVQRCSWAQCSSTSANPVSRRSSWATSEGDAPLLRSDAPLLRSVDRGGARRTQQGVRDIAGDRDIHPAEPRFGQPRRLGAIRDRMPSNCQVQHLDQLPTPGPGILKATSSPGPEKCRRRAGYRPPASTGWRCRRWTAEAQWRSRADAHRPRPRAREPKYVCAWRSSDTRLSAPASMRETARIVRAGALTRRVIHLAAWTPTHTATPNRCLLSTTNARLWDVVRYGGGAIVLRYWCADGTLSVRQVPPIPHSCSRMDLSSGGSRSSEGISRGSMAVIAGTGKREARID